MGYYQLVHKYLTQDADSPYAQVGGEAALPLDQFLWAFSIVSSRQLVLNNSNQSEVDDPNLQLLVMPLLDFLNHAPTKEDENVVALPFHDTVNNESFVIVQATRDIKKGE